MKQNSYCLLLSGKIQKHTLKIEKIFVIIVVLRLIYANGGDIAGAVFPEKNEGE